MTHTTTIQQWGNSLAIRIPKAKADRLKLKRGSKVRIDDAKLSFVVAPVRAKRMTIQERVAGITPENLNIDHEWATMKPVGKEVL